LVHEPIVWSGEKQKLRRCSLPLPIPSEHSHGQHFDRFGSLPCINILKESTPFDACIGDFGAVCADGPIALGIFAVECKHWQGV
jgi:hypothetical protein